jgi:hypothetical protein
MFENRNFVTVEWEEIPLETDCFLVADSDLSKVEAAWLQCFTEGEFDPDYLVTFVAPRSIDESGMEISWYPNISTRFHELAIELPRAEFVTCIHSHTYDMKPHIVVRSTWLRAHYKRKFAAFAIVDAIGVREALKRGGLSRAGLLDLRSELDSIAGTHPDVAFLSFADTVLLKTSWSPGHFETGQKDTYDPERVVRVIQRVMTAFQETIELKAYAVITQGSNEFYEDSLLHISGGHNHVGLNSLGTPFAELFAIDSAVRNALKNRAHPPADLYLDDKFLHSLHLKMEFDRDTLQKGSYRGSGGREASYYVASIESILAQLRVYD